MSSEVVANPGERLLGGENVLGSGLSAKHALATLVRPLARLVWRPHGYFGYDIARGGNDTWYATLICGLKMFGSL